MKTINWDYVLGITSMAIFGLLCVAMIFVFAGGG
jgi:hypothetical protein